MTISRFVMACILAGSMATGGSLASTTPALASGGECTSDLNMDPHIGLDHYRAKAYCFTLDLDSHARPVLIRNGGPDYSGPWFTTPLKWYYTDWYTCYLGCYAVVEVEAI
jgi:hypothetical protein